MDVDTVLYEAPDPYRRLFGMVLVPATGHVSIVLEPAPGRRVGEREPVDAVDAVDEGWVGDLAVWMALLAHEPGLVGCAVTVQRAPTGARRRGLRVLVQPTWRIAGLQGRTDPASLAIEIGARVPGLVRSLDHGGVGSARPLAAREVAAVVHGAYHPASGATGGDGPPGAGAASGRRPWPDAGPADHREHWQHLRHGDAASLTWSMSRVPPSVVLSTVLTPLVAVPPDVALTRVTLLYEQDDARTPDLPQPDDDWTGLGAVARTLPGARGAATPAPGHELPRFTSLVTITAPDGPDGLAEAAATMLDDLPAPLRPWLRPLYGSQAAAFAAGLPTGTLLITHAAPPGLLAGPE
jgi:hypothetical protein